MIKFCLYSIRIRFATFDESMTSQKCRNCELIARDHILWFFSNVKTKTFLCVGVAIMVFLSKLNFTSY